MLTVDRVLGSESAGAVSAEPQRIESFSYLNGPRAPTGRSEVVRQINLLISKVAPYDSSVLILGESGTGKEVVARAIHDASTRRQRPFVAVNCGAIPADLLESELFGHEKGAFTGAITTRKGRFEIAEGGTLFLDEIGDMSMPMQVKLLRVLQERVYERVGGHATLRCDVRIIAATHRNLEQQIERGAFRGDLYYRLNVFPIEMPTLAARIDDLGFLIDEFVEANARAGRSRLMLAPETLAALTQYKWPGNIRELGNLIERLSIMCPDRPVGIGDLPQRYRPASWSGEEWAEQAALRAPTASSAASEAAHRATDDNGNDHEAADAMLADAGTELVAVEWTSQAGDLMQLPLQGIDLRAHLLTIERSLISQALERTGGTVAHAAKLLNLRRTTLVEKLRKLGMVAA